MAPMKFNQDDVKSLMPKLAMVRNVMTAGAMGAGKTCAIDCLAAHCFLVGEDKIGETRFAHARQDEKDKGCTIKANITSLVLDGSRLLHMLDVPGHVEYSAELSVMVPIADGALVVVDASKDAVPVATSQQMKQIGRWGVQPVLFCNRVDTSLLVTKKESQEMVDDLTQIIEAFNIIITSTTEGDPTLMDPTKGNVIIGSAASGWAFAIPTLAAFYAKKMGQEVDKMCTRLWGEQYFNPAKKTWSNVDSGGAVRGFVKLVLDPIKSLLASCDAGDLAKVEKVMKNLDVTIGLADKKLEGNQLFKRMMQLWMPAGPCIADALEKFVPNPKVSQEKRFHLFTEAPTTDPCALAIKNCAADGPLMFNCVKLTPQPSTAGRFFAVGRVFSGTLGADKGFLLEDDYIPPHARVVEEVAAPAEEGEGEAEEEPVDAEEAAALKKAPKGKEKGKGVLTERRIQGVLTGQARQFNSVPNVPAGNCCVCSGIDQFIIKRSTFSASKDNFPFRPGQFSVSAVVKVSLGPKNAKDLPKVVEGLRRLAKSCPLVEVALEDGGQHAIAGCGEEHMRLLRNDLENEFLPGIPLTWDAPSVAYRETVTMESSMMCLSKSPNKHNRLFVKAEPLSEEVNLAIEAKLVYPTQDQKKRASMLEKKFGWDKTDGMKIWGFGPAPEEAGAAYGPNVLVDQTKGVQYLLEIRESVNSGLLWAAKEGPIAEETMRGVRFNLFDVKLHADSIHRGMGQIQPTARRVFYAAAMTAGCRLVEPVFCCYIECPAECQTGIMQALGTCRGELVVSEELPGGRVSVQAFVPIAETIGNTPFATVLSQKTSGKAAASYAFDHWENLPSDPLEYDVKKKIETKAATLMLQIRKRKGLKEEPPSFADYYDKL